MMRKGDSPALRPQVQIMNVSKISQLALIFCFRFSVIKAVVNKITDAKTQGYGTLIKLKRHQRRKVKKTNDFPDRVLVDNDGGCQGDLREHVRTGHQYLIMLEKISPSKKKSKYIVSAIVPWNKKYRSYTRRPYCGGGR